MSDEETRARERELWAAFGATDWTLRETTTPRGLREAVASVRALWLEPARWLPPDPVLSLEVSDESLMAGRPIPVYRTLGTHMRSILEGERLWRWFTDPPPASARHAPIRWLGMTLYEPSPPSLVFAPGDPRTRAEGGSQ